MKYLWCRVGWAGAGLYCDIRYLLERISLTFKEGSERALYRARWTITIARFLLFFFNFINRPDSKPWQNIEKYKVDKTSDLWMVTNGEGSNTYYILGMASMDFNILLPMLLVWSCQYLIPSTQNVKIWYFFLWAHYEYGNQNPATDHYDSLQSEISYVWFLISSFKLFETYHDFYCPKFCIYGCRQKVCFRMETQWALINPPPPSLVPHICVNELGQ